ncbi:hypothetical protein PBY51_020992 [Eleginops maclovinus]|uniref:C2H2-type domain-containing protein n=1 Tax=Eleginops maclovinus TaxID=56733 RepID=A0AAN8ALL0_ELEMC|nr:hypothetical protein PBY51_020992 [Eleginops maclovinus]
MAAEMSCRTGVDEDDKDADPEINALTLLQVPVRMAQESASCTNSFSKPSTKQNSVLDVLSNTDMLSPVGLGNGPSSHQATEAHELNSISIEKEETKSITPLKTVQEIDTAGIWGFDEDSPEDSLDDFSNASDLHWDPHKEFMQFLWENHGDSPGEELKDEDLPSNSQKTRRRKMDMVVMVDPSEDLYPNLSHKSPEELSDAEDQVDSIPFRKFRKSRNLSQSESSPSDFTEDLSELDSERKNCPYCPAVFESGVGLSNHVRGHLHRVGLSYNARHVVPPEQVVTHDRRPRIRRKMSAYRRLKKALQQQESESETVKSIHSCPLCGDSFDNRTGQSNHIRGHLKKLGKSFATKKKSPLCLLRELIRDKKEFQRALQIVGKKRNHFQYGASSKLSSFDRFTLPPIGCPSVCTDDTPLMPPFSLAGIESEEGQPETKLDVKNSLSGTTALIGILKKRKCQEDSKLKGSLQMSRNMFVSSNSEHCPGSRLSSSLPNSICEKGEFNRKMCVHCNATFHSGVSLSNHLRAYAKRKRNALLDGTAFDCKARRHRSRPGSKKKILPLPQTPEEMYRLTCRFCDLVFQGPLSVQEDWIKHLQRHIMNTSVPHTGLGMVEVPSLPTDTSTLKTDQDSSLTATHAAS